MGEVGGGGGMVSGEVFEERAGWRWGLERWVMEGGGGMSSEVRRAPGWRVFGVHVEYRHNYLSCRTLLSSPKWNTKDCNPSYFL